MNQDDRLREIEALKQRVAALESESALEAAGPTHAPTGPPW